MPDSGTERLRDLDVERCVLGQALAWPEDVWRSYREAGLRLDHFWHPPHRALFDAIAAVDADGLSPDVPLVLARLRDSGLEAEVGSAYACSLSDGVPHPNESNVAALVARLDTLSRARRLHYEARNLAARLAEDPLAVGNGIVTRHRALLDELQADAVGVDTAVSETLTALAARVGDASRVPLVGDLFAARETALIAGEERSLKSWTVLDVAVAIATDTLALGLFPVAEPGTVIVVGNEDAPNVYLARATRLLAGRGLSEYSPNLRFVIGQGCSLDDPAWQQRLMRDVTTHHARAVFFDPLRSVTARVDQGPAEWKPAGDFLRALATTTGALVLADHHTTKPPVAVADTRRRTHRVSGGGVVATIDQPILVERIDDTSSLLLPDSYKHGVTPPPLRIQLQLDGPAARLVAEVTTETIGTAVALQERVLAAIRTSGGLSGTKVAQAVRADKGKVLDALRALDEARKIDSVAGPRGARLWFAR